MIRKALEYIVELSKPVLNEINGQTYSDKPLKRVSYIPYAESIELSTLTSLVDYIKLNRDNLPLPQIIHVVSPTCVKMYSSLDEDRNREKAVEVRASVPSFNFNQFTEKEAFVIGLQSKFIDFADRSLLLKFAGTVENGTVATYGDDGVTQKATIKTGIASRSEAIVPNPVMLQPYRTFSEVPQPASHFIFRMRENRGVECAIFEADGGAWKNEAMKNIKQYLEKELKDIDGFIIIS